MMIMVIMILLSLSFLGNLARAHKLKEDVPVEQNK